VTKSNSRRKRPQTRQPTLILIAHLRVKNDSERRSSFVSLNSEISTEIKLIIGVCYQGTSIHRLQMWSRTSPLSCFASTNSLFVTRNYKKWKSL
jgi:hypothetical protein